VRSYRITLRDRQTQTVVGYYDGSWTTDRRRALDLRKREVAEAHAAHMRERCPRNADLIKVEELDAAGCNLPRPPAFRPVRELGNTLPCQ
jgi:hypothetical protein